MCENAAVRCEERQYIAEMPCWQEGPDKFKPTSALCFLPGPHALLFCLTSQPMVRRMGCFLTAPLLTEALKKKRSMDQCQATLTYLSRVGSDEKKRKMAATT